MRRAAIAVAVVVLVSFLIVAFFDWNWIKEPVAALVSEQLGRSVTIEGDLQVDLGAITQLSAQNIRVENATWSDVPHMATVERLELGIDLLALLKGRVVLTELALREPWVLLEVSRQGEENWQFLQEGPEDPAAPEKPALPVIRDLVVTDGTLRYVERSGETELTAAVSTVSDGGDGSRTPLRADIRGAFRGQPLEGTVEAGSYSKLRTGPEAYPIEVRLRSGEIEARLDAALPDPLTQPERLEVDLFLRGSDVKALSELLGRSLPEIDTFSAEGSLEHEDGVWRLVELELALGEGRLRAQGRLDRSQQPDQGFVRIEMEAFPLEVLAPDFVVADTTLGTLDGGLEISATGVDPTRAAGEVLLPSLGRITLSSEGMAYRDPAVDTQFTARFSTEGLEEKNQRTAIEAEGRYHGEPFTLSFQGDPLLDLREPRDPYSIDLDLKAGDTEIHAEGALIDALDLQGMDLALVLEGPNPSLYYTLFGILLPDLPPYRVSGRLTLEDRVWRFQEFDGTVGDSDLHGDILLDLTASPPFLEAKLYSQTLHFDDLGGLVGEAPGEGETAAQAETEETEEVLPEEPFEPQKLRDLNATVYYEGANVQAGPLPLDELVIDFRLRSGRMQFDPLDFGVGGGRVRLQLELDPTQEPAKGKLKAEVVRVDLRRVLDPFDVADQSVGQLGGRGELWMEGRSVAELLGSADGGVYLLMTGGQLDQLVVELAGIDLGEAVLTTLAEDPNVAIDCAYADLYAREGNVELETFVVDTRDSRLLASGTLNLKSETLDLVLVSEPKDASLFSFRAPIHIEGTFSDPSLDPDYTEMAGQFAASIGLGALAGPAALLPLIDFGAGEESARCSGLIERMKEAEQKQSEEP